MPRLFSTKVILCFCFLILSDWIFLVPFKTEFFHPIFFYLMVLYAAFEWHWRHALRFAIAVGILRDLLSTQPLGVETAVLVTATLGLGFCVTKIERHSGVMQVLIGFIFIFGVSLFVLVLSNLLGFSEQPFWKCFGLAGTTAFSTVLFLPLFFFLAGRWFGEKIPLQQYELFR